MFQKCISLALLTCICLVPADASDGNTTKTRLRIVGFFPAHNSPIWPGGFYCIPAALLAVEQINNDPDLLSGYELDFEYLDSGGCGRDAAVERYLEEIASRRTPPVAIIGPGCSESALTLASFSAQPRREALMVSYGATTPTLSNLVAFPYFLRTVHSQTFLGETMARFVYYFKWKAIAMLYEDGLIQRSTVLNFRASLSRLDSDIDLSTTHRLSIPNDLVTKQTEELLEQTLDLIKHRRIIFAFVHRAVGRRLMLQAARRKMVYPGYVWVFPELYGQWWKLSDCPESNETDRVCTSNDDRCTCQQELIDTAMNGAFHFFYNLGQSNDIPTIVSGLSVAQYKSKLDNKTKEFLDMYYKENGVKVDHGGTPFASTTYDAVWAVALGLAVTEQRLQVVNLSLADHTENNALISQVLHRSILTNVSFEGASGDIIFNSHGSVESPVVVRQLQLKPGTTLDHVNVGLFRGDNTTIHDPLLYWNVNEGESQPTHNFPPEYITLATVNVGLLVGVILLTLATLIVNCSFLLINYYFRDLKDVKATSPALNNFIFAGHFSIITYVVVFTIVSSASSLGHVPYGILCNLLPWTLSVGYSLINSTIFWKSWRLYTAFAAKFITDSTESLKDRKLMFRIAVAVLVCDIVPLILFTALTPLQKTVFTENRGILEATMSVCAFPNDVTQYVPYTVSLIAGLKLLIVAFVTFSAVKMLRAKIQIELYNDSGLVFTFVLVQLVLITVSFPLVIVYYGSTEYETRLSVIYSVLTFGPLLTTDAGLAILFLYKYKKLPKAMSEAKVKTRNAEDRSSFSSHGQRSNSRSSSILSKRGSWPFGSARQSQQGFRHFSLSGSSTVTSPSTSVSALSSHGSFSSGP